MDKQLQALQRNLETAAQRADTHEHLKNNESVLDMLGQRSIKPEILTAEEDLQKLERRVKSDEKNLAKHTKALPPHNEKP